jgi:hypothetical protein
MTPRRVGRKIGASNYHWAGRVAELIQLPRRDTLIPAQMDIRLISLTVISSSVRS